GMGAANEHAGVPATVPGATSALLRAGESKLVTRQADAALLLAAHGPVNLDIFRRIGFGSLLIVPLAVRDRVQGAVTFVSREGDPPFTPDETALAFDLATP